MLVPKTPSWRDCMERREILKSTVAVAAATSTLGMTSVEAWQPQSGPAARADRSGPFIQTRDGQRLFYKDWGKGAPVVFLAAWALPSDMWDYQMVPLSEQGLRCLAYDRRGHGRSSQAGDGYDYDTLAD